ncbi:MAG TPA: hypothetical protein VFP61_14450 [Acidimicrobiales bacterium]|nr:hypothetical protein [Acidimicrobiales bacterium]
MRDLRRATSTTAGAPPLLQRHDGRDEAPSMAPVELPTAVLPESVVLAPPHRLTVTVDGAGELLGTPWVELLEGWSASLPAEPLATIGAYQAALCAWLDGCADPTSGRRARSALACWVRDYFLSVRAELLDACEAAELRPVAWRSLDAAPLVESVLRARLQRLQSLPVCPRLAGVDPAGVDGFADVVADAVDWAFDDTPRSGAGDRLLVGIASALVAATESFSTDTVLTFVGSGRASLRPVSRGLVVAGVVAGRVKAWPTERQEAADALRHGSWLAAAHASLDDALDGADDLTAVHEALEDAHRLLRRLRLAAA